MSEVRRKRKSERVKEVEAKSPSRERLIWAGIAVILVVAYVGFWYHNNHRYDEFAKCLASQQAKMYGLYWCPHCADQKAMFGKSFRYVPYVECAIKDSHELAAACTAAGVKLFPSWQFGGNKPIEGVFPMQELSDKTGCSLP
jgi:glutaredoxin